MPEQTLTVNVPGPLYTRLEERARGAQRSVEAELLDVLAATISQTNDPQAITASMALLDDAALWHAARTTLPTSALDQIEQFHDKRQQEGLTTAEAQMLADLMQQYERAIVIRSRAAALLHERGHDVLILVRP